MACLVNEKYKSLQILRALAAWMVVYHHFVQFYIGNPGGHWLSALFERYGTLGVDIFFVLSGVVMFTCVSHGTTSARVFWVNRMFRIAPVYWAATGLAVLLKLAIPAGFVYTEYSAQSLLCSLLFLPTSNPSGIGYFPLLTVGWTLNYEMLFYTMLALCMYVGKQYAVPLCAMLMAAVPYLWPKDWLFGQVIAGNYLLYEFVVGLCIGALLNNPSAKASLARWGGPVALLGTSFLVVVGPKAGGDIRFDMPTAAVVVLLALLAEPLLDERRGWVRQMVRLGDESYSTYLIHTLVIGAFFGFTGAQLSLPALFLVLCGVTVLIVLCSRLSCRYVERATWLADLRDRSVSPLPSVVR